MSRRTIFFDFDGTIADVFALVVPVMRTFAQEEGAEDLAQMDIEILRGFSARELLAESGFSWWQLWRLIRRVRRHLAEHLDEAQLFPGFSEVATELKRRGYHLSIVTSNTEVSVRRFLQQQNLECFDHVVSSARVFGKGRTLARLMHQQHLNPAETWYIGDEIRDIEAARHAHMKSASVTWGFNSEAALREHMPDAVATQPQDLLTLFPEFS
jgi:phosphoglycolate phosphatase